jgi:hypothetical protein
VIRRVLAMAALIAGLGRPSVAQGYRLRLDTRLQVVSFRGLTADSIAAADAVTGPGGGPATPDGFAVTCGGGDAYCHFYRPGPILHGAPIVTSADLTLWGLGLPGLSARLSGRAAGEMGNDHVWPGTSPEFQLLEGYLDYATPRATVRLGRQVATSRLGYEGFDGGRLLLRDARSGLELDGYLGWGLTQGAALPVTSPALNPLDDFQPRRRQIVAGAGAGWTGSWAEVLADYLREVDPDVDYFVSERLGVQAVVRPPVAGLTLQGGSDWDLAMGEWGSAEGSVTYTHSRFTATAGARRYRPHFALWTIWGAFSPVPYHATFGRVSLRATDWLDVRASGEQYAYSPADVSTALVVVEDAGWRYEVGATASVVPGMTVDGTYQADFGPGASAAGATGTISYAPDPRILVTLQGATLQRPLEFRFDESRLKSIGVDVQASVAASLRLGVGGAYYSEGRRRPDAQAFDWNQFRVTAFATIALGKGADLRGLPPAVRRMPVGERP